MKISKQSYNHSNFHSKLLHKLWGIDSLRQSLSGQLTQDFKQTYKTLIVSTKMLRTVDRDISNSFAKYKFGMSCLKFIRVMIRDWNAIMDVLFASWGFYQNK